MFLTLDRLGRTLGALVPGWVRRRAIAKAERWIIERLNGTNGLGAIFPAMVNAHEVLAVLGYPPEHPHRVATKEALRRLLVIMSASFLSSDASRTARQASAVSQIGETHG